MSSHAIGRLKAWALCGALAACVPAGARAAVFVCRTADGGTVTSDYLSSDCLQYGGKQLNPDGSVRRLILTTQQQQQQQAQLDREQAQRERLLREQRQQRALLGRYPDAAALRSAENDDLHSVQALIDAARQRLKVLAREQVHLEQDAQFYPGGNYPEGLRSRMRMNQSQRVQEQQLIRQQQEQMQDIGQRYAALRERLQPLWARAAQAAGH